MKLWFGQHKGKDVRDVPQSYLEWMLANMKLKKAARRLLAAEASRDRAAEPVDRNLERQLVED
jgi:hypothetical protein